MKKLFIAAALVAGLALAACKPAVATPGPQDYPVETINVTCADFGYSGTKLTWCQNICEKGYTGATLDMWIRRWVDRYRTLPYCYAQ